MATKIANRIQWYTNGGIESRAQKIIVTPGGPRATCNK